MPVSKTEICNMALGHVGILQRVTDIDDPSDSSNEAIACRNFYDTCRKLLLEMRPWNFATTRATLQPSGTAFDGWTYSYKFPSGCRRANKIVNPLERTESTDSKIPFRVVNDPSAYGKLIMTDEEDAVLEYNKDIEDPNLFSMAFVNALTFFLASYIANPLRVNAKLADYVNGQFLSWMAEASIHNMSQGQPDTERASEFQSARG